MTQRLAHISVLVRDYDDALDFYLRVLGFELREDTELPLENKRWVVISPAGAGSDGCSVLLAKASSERQHAAIGNQSGGRVFLFLETDDFWRDYDAYKQRGVVFVREPAQQPYGTVAVFEDLYGNHWDLIEYDR